MIAAVLLLGLAPAASQVTAHALIVGVNQPGDASLTPLRYADDDAARYFDLFRALGASTQVLARFDDNTLRLHPGAAAVARPPTRHNLDAALKTLAGELAAAKMRAEPTVLYVVYAGHGSLRDGALFLSLEDGELGGEELEAEVLPTLAADNTHLIVDACNSFYLAYGRGPGGSRRPVSGLTGAGTGLAARGIGLLLSTSSASESHEWEGFQAGVFSHEVRSGLYGAADADGDGTISYREVAAFVDNANRGVPNERFRPVVFARAPAGAGTLIDLRQADLPAVRVDGALGGRYLIEDAAGVRLLDFHNGRQQATVVRRPAGGRYYMQRLDGTPAEYELPETPRPVELSGLSASAPRSISRGAAHESFMRLFELAFDRNVVASFSFPVVRTTAEESLPLRDVVGWSAMAAGAVGAVASAVLVGAAYELRDSTPANLSNRDALARNEQLRDLNLASGAALCVGVGALIAGAAWLWWPVADDAELGASGAEAHLRVRW